MNASNTLPMKKIIILTLFAVGFFADAAVGADAAAVPDSRTQIYSPADVSRAPQLRFRCKPKYPAELKAEGIAADVVVSASSISMATFAIRW